MSFSTRSSIALTNWSVLTRTRPRLLLLKLRLPKLPLNPSAPPLNKFRNLQSRFSIHLCSLNFAPTITSFTVLLSSISYFFSTLFNNNGDVAPSLCE
ncbi:hypothetical protein K450DRAFT_218191 [Umbelopsis ramanniana AG]|uniref:Uncharacterized protein n=1 Tax=Umbelopsis ramanniana AG TaxID=1314678 RepID=A0AAD5EJI6_UMBRA|nr:uncharacterized protein K450DRAFT_218191 [Umbelopsis ramanniana AG]KAI8584111.1 hypothetical protein K450DRAFT_218191 [Umbelopsis ramanniana AG]